MPRRVDKGGLPTERGGRCPTVLRAFMSLLSAFVPSAIAAGGEGEIFGDAAHLFSLEWSRSGPELRHGDVDHVVVAENRAWILAFADDQVVGLDPGSGELLWHLKIPYDKGIEPAIGETTLVVASTSNELVAFDLRSGERSWSLESPDELLSVLTDGKAVYIANSAGSLTVINENAGTRRWQRMMPKSIIEAPTIADSVDSVILVPLEDGELHAFAVADGTFLWKTSLGAELATPVVAEDGVFFVTTQDQSIVAIRSVTGETLWAHRIGVDDPIKGPLLGLYDPPILLNNRLFLLGHMGMGNLRVFDQRTGEQRYVGTVGGGPSITFIAVDRFVLIPVASTNNNIFVFDTERDYIVHRTEVSGGVTILGQSGASVFFVANDRLGRATFDPDAVRAIREHVLAGSARDVAYPAVVVMVLLLGALLYALTGQPRIPPIHDTSLRLLVILWTAIVVCALCIYAGILLIRAALLVTGSPIAVALGISLFAPALILTAAYMFLYRWKERRVLRRCQPPTEDSLDQVAIRRMAEQLRITMGIPDSVGIHFSNQPNISPVAIGISPSHAQLILPANLYDLSRNASEGQEQLATEVIRLVLAHEMAHIRNGDVRIVPLAWALRAPLLWCFIAILAIYVVLRPHDDAIGTIAGSVVVVMAAGTILGSWMLRSTLRERERLADATATLYVAPESIQRLAQPPGTTQPGPSVLERFVLSLQRSFSWSRSFLGFAIPAPRSWIRRLLQQRVGVSLKEFQRVVLSRSRALVEKTHAVPGTLMPSVASVSFAGILGALVYVAFAVTIQYSFIGHMVTTHPGDTPDLLDGFLKSMSLWSGIQEDVLAWRIYRTLGPLVTAMAMVGLVFLPLREARAAFNRLAVWDLFHLAGSLGLALIVFAIVYGFLSSWTRPPFATFPALRVSGLPVLGWVIVAGLGFVLFLPVREAASTQLLSRIILRAALVLTGMGVAVAVTLLVCRGMTPWGRLLWAMCACTVTLWLYGTNVFRILAYEQNVPDERCLVQWRLGRRRIAPLPSNAAQGFGGLVAEATIAGLLTPLLLMAVAYPLLISLDSQFFESYREFHNSYESLLSQAVERLQEDRRAFASEFLPRSIVHQFVGPDRLLPSTALGGVALVLCALLTATGMVVQVIRGESRKMRWLKQLSTLVELSKMIDLAPVHRQMKLSLQRLLTPGFLARKRRYIQGPGGAPLTHRTCQMIEASEFLSLESTRAVEMIDWVYECEKPDGGFGVAPEAPADALHTTSALLMLRAVGRRPRYAPTIHERWIRRSMLRCLRPPGPLPEAARLDAMSQLLRAHVSLPEQTPLPMRLRMLLADESIGWWRRTARTTRDTRHLVQIIQHFDTHDPNVYAEVQHTWLPGQERRLPSLKPAAALPEARDLVWILWLLFPDSYRELDTVVQLRDNLIKDYHHRGLRKKLRPSFGVSRRPTE